MEQLLVNKTGDPIYLPWHGDGSSSLSPTKEPSVNSQATKDKAPSVEEFDPLFSYSAPVQNLEKKFVHEGGPSGGDKPQSKP